MSQQIDTVYPPNFDPRGLQPFVHLSDWRGLPTHNPAQFAEEFKLVAWHIRAAHSGDFGDASLLLQDDDAELLDRSSTLRPITIRYGQILQIDLGRDAASAVPWFLGICQEPTTVQVAPNRRNVAVRAVGYAQRLADRFASISHVQQRLPDGVSPDSEDNSSTITSLLFDLLRDDRHLDTGAPRTYPIIVRREHEDRTTTALSNRRAIQGAAAGLRDPGAMSAAYGAADSRRLVIWDEHTAQSRFTDYDYDPNRGQLSDMRDLAGTATLVPGNLISRSIQCMAVGGGAVVGQVSWRRPGQNAQVFNLRGAYDIVTGRTGPFTFSQSRGPNAYQDLVGLCFIPPNRFIGLNKGGTLLMFAAPAPNTNLGAPIAQLTGVFSFGGSVTYGALAYAPPRLIVQANGTMYDVLFDPRTPIVSGTQRSLSGRRTIRSNSPNVSGMAYIEGKLITAEDPPFASTSVDALYDYDYDPTLAAGSTPLGPLEPKIDYVPVRLPDFFRRGQPLSTITAELAATANCVWGVAPDRHFYLRRRGANDSGIIISNDVGVEKERPGSIPEDDVWFRIPRINAAGSIDASGVGATDGYMYVLDKTRKTVTEFNEQSGAALGEWAIPNLPANEIPYGLDAFQDADGRFIEVATEYDTGTRNALGQTIWQGWARQYHRVRTGLSAAVNPVRLHGHEGSSTVDAFAYSQARRAYFVLRARAEYNAEILGYPLSNWDSATAQWTSVNHTGDIWGATGMVAIGEYLFILDVQGWVRVYIAPTVPAARPSSVPYTALTRQPNLEFAVQPGGQGLSSSATGRYIYVVVPDTGVYRYDWIVQAFQRRPGHALPVRSRITDNWNPSKLCVLRNRPQEYADSGIGAAYTTVIGTGAQREPLAYSQGDVPNASLLLHTGSLAVPFRPRRDNVAKITLLLGSGQADISALPALQVYLLGSMDSEPDAQGNTVKIPNPEDVRASEYILSGSLQALLENRLGVHAAVKFGRIQTDPQELLWIYVPQYGAAPARVSIDYRTTADPNNPESYYYFLPAEGQPGAGVWARRSGTMSVRIHTGETVRIIAQNAAAAKIHPPKETTYPLRDYPDIGTAEDALVGILEANGRVIRRYGPVIATPPTHPPPLGATARMQDYRTGLDATVEIAGWSINGSAHEANNLAPTEMEFTLVDRSH